MRVSSNCSDCSPVKRPMDRTPSSEIGQRTQTSHFNVAIFGQNVPQPRVGDASFAAIDALQRGERRDFPQIIVGHAVVSRHVYPLNAEQPDGRSLRSSIGASRPNRISEPPRNPARTAQSDAQASRR